MVNYCRAEDLSLAGTVCIFRVGWAGLLAVWLLGAWIWPLPSKQVLMAEFHFVSADVAGDVYASWPQRCLASMLAVAISDLIVFRGRTTHYGKH